MEQPGTVFVDRDGVINRKLRGGAYVNEVSQFELLPGAASALAALSNAGSRVIVVTNQQGVAKGLTQPQALDQIHQQLYAAVTAAGGEIAAIMVCPHLEGSCDCRKPRIGLFVEAQRRFPQIEFSDSVVIGDSACDIEAAERMGADAIFVTSEQSEPTESLCAVDSLTGAVELLLSPERAGNEV